MSAGRATNMIKYGCWYQWWVIDEAEFEVRWVEDVPDVPALQGMGAFVAGFWIDKEGQLCHEHDRILYWIPPSRIVRIEREIIDDQT